MKQGQQWGTDKIVKKARTVGNFQIDFITANPFWKDLHQHPILENQSLK